MKPADGVVFKQVGDELVLLDFDRGIYYGLDPIGARMWQLLAAGQSADAAVEVLVDEYDVSREEVMRDLDRLISELREQRLLID